MDFEPTKKWLVGDKRTFDKYVFTTQYEKGKPTQAQLIYFQPTMQVREEFISSKTLTLKGQKTRNGKSPSYF